MQIFCIVFIDFMLAGKTLIEFTNLFSPNNFVNDDIILNYFMTNVQKWLNAFPLIMVFMKHLICIQIYKINNSLDLRKSMKLKIILLLRLKKETNEQKTLS